MGYSASKGRKPFERASKIGHSEIINDPAVVAFVDQCVLPGPPEAGSLEQLLEDIPSDSGRITTVIAIDGGLTETYVRSEFPSAAIGFLALGPLLLRLEDLADLDYMPFIGPDDMARLKHIERYAFAFPTRGVRYGKAATFSQGVRLRVQEFLTQKDGHLMAAFQWLLFEGWRAPSDQMTWKVPNCPTSECTQKDIEFAPGGPVALKCSGCGADVYLADALRLYERIDDELGASSVLSYLLTALEQVVLVYMIKSVLEIKPALLKEILFVKDGPLAFFGVTASLSKPMRSLMTHLTHGLGEPHINLIGLEKSGAFVEHASAIENSIPSLKALPLTNEYIYKYIVPGDPSTGAYGGNTYYGGKVIFKGEHGDMYVASLPQLDRDAAVSVDNFVQAGDVMRSAARLRCSMYDNALIPVALANKLVSLADVPSADILKKFVKEKVH
jgi:hypothetical protein